jgi:hypothetical protein
MDIVALKIGAIIIVFSAVVSIISVLVMRRFTEQSVLVENQPFLKVTSATVSMVYGVFLAFTIVITWGEFDRADASSTAEVTHLSELWWNSDVFSQQACREIHGKLVNYAALVVSDDWPSMAANGRHADSANASYRALWKSFSAYEPDSDKETLFYSESIRQLNELGTARRHRELFASAGIPPLVSLFLILGGVISIVFLLLLPCPSLKMQLVITTLVATLITFSVFLVLSFQRPFSGVLSVEPSAFEEIGESYERRSQESNSCGYPR